MPRGPRLCQAGPVKWWRPLVVAILAVLTGLVAPLSVVAAWAHTQVSDTDAFVAAYAPLADDPAVQQALAATISDTIQARLDLPGLTEQLLDDLVGSNPIAGRLLPSLTGPLNGMVADFIDEQVGAFVASDAFGQAFRIALRSTHTQFVALLSGEESAALVVQDGQLQLQLAPFVEAVKQRLVANGFPLAGQIPPVTTTIGLVAVDPQALARARAAYRVLGLVAEWLPWLLLLLPALALFISRTPRSALIACAAAIPGGIGLAWLLLRAGVAEAAVRAAGSGVGEAAVLAVADGALGPMRGPAMAAAATGLVVTLLAWLTGRRVASD